MTAHTDEQARTVLDLIADSLSERGYPPSRREVANRLRLGSTSSAQQVIDRMERDGLIERDPTIPRGIRIKNSVMVERTETV